MKKAEKSIAQAAADLAGDASIEQEVDSYVSESLLVECLAGLRMNKGMTQAQIAEQLNCDASKVSRLESMKDADLKWGDVVAYLQAVNASLTILVDDESLPRAMRIKHHVLQAHKLLQELISLAGDAKDDRLFVDKINQFCGEVLFNFCLRFEENYGKLQSVINVNRAEGPAQIEDPSERAGAKKAGAKKSKDAAVLA